LLGPPLGLLLCDVLGRELGSEMGLELGNEVGDTLGDSLGSTLGEKLGLCVGFLVGVGLLAVGTGVVGVVGVSVITKSSTVGEVVGADDTETVGFDVTGPSGEPPPHTQHAIFAVMPSFCQLSPK